MSFGSYYAFQQSVPISGLGQTDQNMLTVATTAMQSLLSSVKPIGTFIPWANQVGDRDFQDIASPEQRYQLYAVTAQALQAAETAALGQPVGFVAFFCKDQLALADVENAFEGTPFEFLNGEGIFDETDPNEIPRAYFLYWGQLRDSDKRLGSYDTLIKNGSALGAAVVFPIQLPIEDAPRSAPSISFTAALSAQQADQQVAAPSTATTVAAPGGSGKALLALAVFGLAGYAGYRWARKR